MKIRRLAIALAWTSLAYGCKPSPDEIALQSLSGQSLGARVQIVEGDVLVLSAVPKDDADETKLCVTATSSNPSALEVLPVKNDCQKFVLAPRAPADGVSLQFSAREGVEELTVDVRSSPTP